MNQTIKKIIHFPITKIIIIIGICFSLFVGIQNFILKPLFYSFIPDNDIANPIIHLISFFVLYFGYFYTCRLYDKREITELSLQSASKEIFGGLGIGFFSISLSIFILYLLGNYQVFDISTDHYSLKLFTSLVVAAFIEDLFTRGLIVREIENWLGTNIAIITVMLLETWHLFNPNANAFSLFVDLTWGFTMTMLFVYSKRVWLPFFFHLGWNFAQPFYGSNLTGLDSMGTIIQSKFVGSEWLTGGAVGIENSVITVTFLLSIGLILYYRAVKEGKIITRSQLKIK